MFIGINKGKEWLIVATLVQIPHYLKELKLYNVLFSLFQ